MRVYFNNDENEELEEFLDIWFSDTVLIDNDQDD